MLKVHFVGILGNGMLPLAILSKKAGFEVSGSDKNTSLDKLLILQKNGISFFVGHNEASVEFVDMVVHSAAIHDNNIEIVTARGRFIPIKSRQSYLAYLFGVHHKEVVSICGTFAKTSTSYLLFRVLSELGQAPSGYIGLNDEKVLNLLSIGEGPLAVVETCEYLNEFYHVVPDHIILTGIAANHEDFFGSGDYSVSSSFVHFIKQSRLSADRILAASSSARILRKYFPEVENSITTYGSDSYSDWQLLEGCCKKDDDRLEIHILYKGKSATSMKLLRKERSFLSSLLPVYAFCATQNVIMKDLKSVLESFSDSISRRFEKKFENNGLVIIDDNARIPEQLECTIQNLHAVFPTHKKMLVLGIWGTLNNRNLEAYAEIIKDVEHVAILTSAEFPNEIPHADRVLAGMLSRNGISAIVEEDSGQAIASMIEPDDHIVVCTIGFDSYAKQFALITANIINSHRKSVVYGNGK